MCRNSVSLLIAILFAIIILSPLTAFSEVTATKLELEQNPDDTYSLYAEFLSDQETKVRFTLITNYQEGRKTSRPLETPDDGGYNLHPDETRRIRFDNVIPPDSISEIVKAYIQYNIVSEEEYHDLANGTGEIKGYIDEEGKNIQFGLPSRIELKIKKVNFRKVKKGEVSLDLKKLRELYLELEIRSDEFKSPYTVIISGSTAGGDLSIKEFEVTKQINPKSVEFAWKGDKEIVLKAEIRDTNINDEASVMIFQNKGIFSNLKSQLQKLTGLMMAVGVLAFIVISYVLYCIVMAIIKSSRERKKIYSPKQKRRHQKQEIIVGTDDTTASYPLSLDKTEVKEEIPEFMGMENERRNEAPTNEKKEESVGQRYEAIKDIKEKVEAGDSRLKKEEGLTDNMKEKEPNLEKLVQIWDTYPAEDETQAVATKINAENVPNSNIKPYRLNINRANMKVILEIHGEQINHWDGKPDWLKIDVKKPKDGIFSFEATSITNKPKVLLWGYKDHKKKHLVAKVLIVPGMDDEKAPTEKAQPLQENIVDDTAEQETQAVGTKINAEKHKILIETKGIKGGQTLKISNPIHRWTAENDRKKPDWLKIDMDHKKGEYTFRVNEFPSKTRNIKLFGYTGKKQLAAEVNILVGRNEQKSEESQKVVPEEIKHALKKNGDVVLVILSPDNLYTEKIKVISESQPILGEKSPIVNGKVFHRGIEGEWIVELSISKNNQDILNNEEVKIEAKYLVRDGKSYVLCMIPEQPPIGHKPIKLTLELADQKLDLSLSKDSAIRLETTENGQFVSDKANDPSKIEIPIPERPEKRNEVTLDQALAVLVLHSSHIFANLNANDEAIRKKHELLAEWAKNPESNHLLKRLFGLDIKEEPEKDYKQKVKPEENIVEAVTKKEIDASIQDDFPKIEGAEISSTADEDKYIQALTELKESIQKASYKGQGSDVKMLEFLINNIRTVNATIGDMEKSIADDFGSPILSKLMDWGISFYRKKQSDPQKPMDSIWQIYTQKMNDPFKIFVIWQSDRPYNKKDHTIDGSPYEIDLNARVESVIVPGYKVSALASNSQIGTIKRARVKISDNM